MSKLSDYSKFDNLNDDSSCDDEPQQAAAPPVGQPVTLLTVDRGANRVAFVFEHNGRPVYQWEQGLSEVTLIVPGPPGPPGKDLRSSHIVCNISAATLQIGLKGFDQYFIDESTFDKVDVAESTWTLEEYTDEDEAEFKTNSNPVPKKKIVVYLQKVAKGKVWDAALKGRFDVKLNPMQLEKVKEDLMKERWQEENPGMDFSGAQFNGSAPDPRTFMGGIRYD